MQCPECGFTPSNELLRYCEECGAKMPARPAGRGSLVEVRGESAVTRRRAPTRTREAPEDDATPPAEDVPSEPPYEGPVWLKHVPGHSPSVLGVGLMAAAVVLGILPFFASVGPFFSTVVLAGGLLLVARELRAVGGKSPLVDWVPESLHPPAVAAIFAGVSVVLAARMLGLGITPVLWALGAGLVAHEQYQKVYAGPEGFQRFFAPRLLLKGTRLVALVSTTICTLAMYLTWTRDGAAGVATQAPTPPVPVPMGARPPQLQVMDAPRSQAYELMDVWDVVTPYGWDRPLSVFVALLLLGSLAVLALKPDENRPSWVRFLPLGGGLLSLVWCLVNMKLQPGPIVFLAGLLGVLFVGVVQAIPPKSPEPEYGEGEYGGEYGDAGYGEYGEYGDYSGYDDPGNRGGGSGFIG